jgi:hypothetical protein
MRRAPFIERVECVEHAVIRSRKSSSRPAAMCRLLGGGVDANPRLVGKDATCSGPNTAGGREAGLAGAGPTWQSTHRVITRDGRTIWVRDEAVLVYDDAGEPRYWQGLSFNITDRTMAELEATRRLAALDELRNSMLTAISHELRTPLAGILGASVTLECAGGRMSEEATAELLRGAQLQRPQARSAADQPARPRAARLGHDSAESPAVRHRRPAGAGGVTLAQRDPLATSLRIFDDGMAGSRQGGAYRRGVAGQHCTAHPTGHSGLDLSRPSGHRPAPGGRGRRPRHAERDAHVGVRALPPRRDRPYPTYARPGYWPAQLHGGTAWVEDRPGGGSSFQVTLPGPPH